MISAGDLLINFDKSATETPSVYSISVTTMSFGLNVSSTGRYVFRLRPFVFLPLRLLLITIIHLFYFTILQDFNHTSVTNTDRNTIIHSNRL